MCMVGEQISVDFNTSSLGRFTKINWSYQQCQLHVDVREIRVGSVAFINQILGRLIVRMKLTWSLIELLSRATPSNETSLNGDKIGHLRQFLNVC